MAANVETFKKSSIATECFICKGSCWNPNSQAKTQETVLKKFGKMPNSCINDCDGTVRCPAALGLLDK